MPTNKPRHLPMTDDTSRHMLSVLPKSAGEVLRRRTSRALTDEDVRDSVANLVGFFGVLSRWALDEAASKAKELTAASDDVAAAEP